ncbi:MAG: hypothetical protein ACOYJF_06780 [Prevotella sp.]|jgi:hypothetical protein
MIHRLQNRIAESRVALPWTTVFCLIIWLIGGTIEKGLWLQFFLLGLSTLMMMALNKVNALIRIYSRMVSCSYIVMCTMAVYLYDSLQASVVSLSLIVFYFALFHAYQDKRAVGWVFYAFVSLSVGSIFFVQLLYFIPLMWMLLATNVLAFSVRTFFSSILGTLLPYWFLGAYCLWTNETQELVHHFTRLVTNEGLFCYNSIDIHRWVTIAIVAALALTGIIHFLRNSFRDKIRTRMIYEMFIVVDIAIFIAMVIFPGYADPLLAMLIATTAPLIGHYLALTHTRLTNISFFVIIIITLLTTCYNLWM